MALFYPLWIMMAGLNFYGAFMSVILDEVKPEVFERVWRLVEEIGNQERHFNELQSNYRQLASTWLLAVCAGLGFLATETLQIQFLREPLMAAVAGAGCIGILLLWFIDLLVYHRLLDACFVEGLLLEEEYPWLPQVRHNMMLTQKKEGVLARVVAFYTVPVMLLLLVAGCILYNWLSVQPAALGVLLLSGIVAVLAGWLMWRKTGNTDSLRRRLDEVRQRRAA